MNSNILAIATQVSESKIALSIEECLERFAHVESGGTICDLLTGDWYGRQVFVELIGIKRAGEWNRHADKKLISVASFRSGVWSTYVKPIVIAGESVKTIIKPKLKTVHVESDDTYLATKPDLVDSRLSILSLKSPDLSAVGGGSIRSLGFAEISIVMSYAKLDDIATAIVRVIHCHDKQSTAHLVELLTTQVIATKRVQGKELCGGKQDVVRKLVSVAIYDYLQTKDKRPISNRQRASFAGVAESTYRENKYSGIVDGIIEQIEDRYAVARAKIYRQLVSD